MNITRVLLFLFLFTIGLFAASDTALSIAIKTAKSTTPTSDVSIVMTNETAKSLKVLKWNTPLENRISANLFDVTYKGKPVTYTGFLIKRAAPTEADYTLFKPGESRNVTIDLSQYYKIETAGEYTVSYKGSVKVIPVDNTKKTFSDKKVTANKNSFIVTPPITLNLTPTEKKTIDAKLAANFDQCTAQQEITLNSAHDTAVDLARIASNDMNAASVPTSALRYAEWFGAAETNRHNTIKEHFNNVLSVLDTEQVTFSCDCSDIEDPSNTYAYVYPNQPYTIHLCDVFWNVSLSGTDSQAGTIIHETTHFNVVAGTDDFAYGQSACRDLANSNPNNAVMNADSHEFFAENTPALTMEEASGFSISGYVIDVETGNGIENVLISLSGTESDTTYSNASGYYTFTGLASGNYTLSATHNNYNTDTASIALNSNTTINYNLIANSATQEYRVVLSWGASPKDLDSHLYIASTDGKSCSDVLYWNNAQIDPYASLDVEDDNGYGPETVTISQLPVKGSDEYWVYNYSGTPNLSTSNAVVKVYLGSTLIKTFHIPAQTDNSAGSWHVFNISQNGISAVNELSDTENSTCTQSIGRPLSSLLYLLLN